MAIISKSNWKLSNTNVNSIFLELGVGLGTSNAVFDFVNPEGVSKKLICVGGGIGAGIGVDIKGLGISSFISEIVPSMSSSFANVFASSDFYISPLYKVRWLKDEELNWSELSGSVNIGSLSAESGKAISLNLITFYNSKVQSSWNFKAFCIVATKGSGLLSIGANTSVLLPI